MPSFIKTKEDEQAWNEAKEAAKESGLGPNDGDKFWGTVNKIYQNKKSQSVRKSWEDNIPEIEDFLKSNPHISEQIANSPMKYRLAMEIMEADYEKAEHIDDKKRSQIANAYKAGKGSVRSLADKMGVSKKQVATVVEKLPKQHKTEEKIRQKQSDNARWKGKHLRPDMVKKTHTFRNEAIKQRGDSTMEAPIRRWLNEFGIKFKTQVSISDLVGGDDPEMGIVDFYIPSSGGGKGCVLQADGNRHSLADVSARCKKQDAILHKHGYKVIHITTSDMNKNRARDIVRRIKGG